MKTDTNNAVPAVYKPTIHRSTAERSLERTLLFLRTVGTDMAIQDALREVGFTAADQKEGWALILRAYAAPAAAVRFTPNAGPVADAVQELQAWQDTMFVRSHAALRRLHPEQDRFVFDNVAAGSGIACVPPVSMFLDRLDALESSPERKSSRKADHAALETLARRGLTSESRKGARQLVKLIETTTAPVLSDKPVEPDARTAALEAVYAWFQDWSECARSVIKNRSQLIRLGMGKRRSRKSTAAATVSPQPVTVVVSPDAPQLQMKAIAALPASNGTVNGSISVPGNGDAHA